MNFMHDFMDSLSVGDVRTYKNMAVGFVYGPESGLEYLTLDDALRDRKSFSIRETQIVNELDAENKTGNCVLLLEGDYLIGGSQNRMVARSLLTKKDFKGKIPVCCVEKRRWDGKRDPFTSSGKSAPTSVRYAAAKSQGEVWQNVDIISDATQTESPTESIHDVYKNKEKDLHEYTSKFPLMPNALGIAVAVKNGRTLHGLDIFDRYKTMQKNFPKLIESYALEAFTLASQHNAAWDGSLGNSMDYFLKRIPNACFVEEPSISEGVSYRIKDTDLDGAFLAYKGKILHFTAGDKRN